MVVISEMDNDAGTLVTRNNAPPKSYDRQTGIQTVRGSQRYGAGIIESVIAAYSNLAYHPVALVMFVIGTFILMAAVVGLPGPLEVLAARLLIIIQDVKTLPVIRSIAQFFYGLVVYITGYKLILSATLLIWAPYAVKPSSRNMTIAIILTFVVLFIRSFTAVELFTMSQMFYLVTMVRTPTMKFIIICAFFLLFCLEAVNLGDIIGATTKMLHNATDGLHRPLHLHKLQMDSVSSAPSYPNPNYPNPNYPGPNAATPAPTRK